MLSVIIQAKCLQKNLSLSDVSSLESVLFEALSLVRPYPYASLLLEEKSEQAKDKLLCLTPLSLLAGMRELAIQAMGTEIDLSNVECKEIIMLLKPLMAEYNIDIFSRNSHLFISTDREIKTVPFFELKNASIKSCMPTGEKNNFWSRLFVECQMLLSTAVFNQRRQQNNQPMVNALWLWGEGRWHFSESEICLLTDNEFIIQQTKLTPNIILVSTQEFLSMKKFSTEINMVIYLSKSNNMIEKKISQLNKHHAIHRVWRDGQITICQNGFLSKIRKLGSRYISRGSKKRIL